MTSFSAGYLASLVVPPRLLRRVAALARMKREGKIASEGLGRGASGRRLG